MSYDQFISIFLFVLPQVASPTVNLPISPSVKGGPTSPSASEAPVTDYDYAYNRSWSMGVQVSSPASKYGIAFLSLLYHLNQRRFDSLIMDFTISLDK